MNGYPGYNGFGGVAPEMYGAVRQTERRSMRRLGLRMGLCAIAFVFLQRVAVAVLAWDPTLYRLYLDDAIFAGVFDILFSVVTMCPFFIAFARMAPQEKALTDRFARPLSKSAAVAAVVSGYFFCTVGNFLTGVLLSSLEDLGFSVGGGEYLAPKTAPQLVMTVFLIGLLPALLEEFSLRGVVMQPLRRYGDRFAVLMTAFVFALMHGNLTQIPFAFIAGIAIGYYVIATDSIWVGIAIHALNNITSVLLSYLLQVRPTAGETFYHLETSISLVGGVLCTALFLTVCRRHRLQNTPPCTLDSGEKIRLCLLNVPMILSILVLIVETVRLIRFTG